MISKGSVTIVCNPYLKKPRTNPSKIAIRRTTTVTTKPSTAATTTKNITSKPHNSKALSSTNTTSLRTTVTKNPVSMVPINKTPSTKSNPPKLLSSSTNQTKSIGKLHEQKLFKTIIKSKEKDSKISASPSLKNNKPKIVKTPTLKSRLKHEIKQIRQDIRKKKEEEARILKLKQQKEEIERNRRRKEEERQKKEEERKLKLQKEMEELKRKALEAEENEREFRKLTEKKKEDEKGHISNSYCQGMPSVSTNPSLINNAAQVNQNFVNGSNFNYPTNNHSNYNALCTSQVNPSSYPPNNNNQQQIYPQSYNPYYGYHPPSGSYFQNFYHNYPHPPQPYNYSQYYPYSNYGYNQPVPNYQSNFSNTSIYYSQPKTAIIQHQQCENRQVVEDLKVTANTPILQSLSHENQIQQNGILPSSNVEVSKHMINSNPAHMLQSLNQDNQFKKIAKENTILLSNNKVPAVPANDNSQPPNPPSELPVKLDEEIFQDLIYALQSFTLSKDGLIPLLNASSKSFEENMIEYLLNTTLSSYLSSSPKILELWSRFSNSIEVEAKRRSEQYWKRKWKHECQAYNTTEIIEYMTDAKRSNLRNSPRPNVGCKCGSKTHNRVYFKECVLYRDLKLISNYQEEESASNQDNSSTTTSAAVMEMHKERAKKRIKIGLEEDYKEAKFVNAMEIVQTTSLQKAIFAPKYLSIMIISTIMSLQTKEGKKENIFSMENDDILLNALATKSSDVLSFSQAIKKSISNIDKNAVTLRNIVFTMSHTWGHVYQELPPVEYAWLWHLRTNKSNKMTQFKNPRYSSHFLPLETLHLLLNEEEKNLLSQEHVISYIISSFRSGIIDDLYVLYTRKIILIDINNGEISLYHDWHSKVEQVVVEDMYQQRYYKQDLCNKFNLQESVCDALRSTWKQKEDKSYHRKDNDTCFASLEIERKAFEEIYNITMDQKEGIGAFGLSN